MSDQKKKFILLSGLPRTGSTLLVALLTQNKNIYGEGASALCQLMWDAQTVFNNADAIKANKRFGAKHDVLSALPDLYYKDVEQPIVIEKGRTWTHPLNMAMWLNHVDDSQKTIVLVRPIEDIARSMASLRIKNGWEGDPYQGLFDPGSEPICRAAEAVGLARKMFPERLLFVDYRDMVSEPLRVLDSIYSFYGLEPCDHDVNNIQLKKHEDDTVHGLLGMHDIRPTISVRKIDLELPEDLKPVCQELNKLVYGDDMEVYRLPALNMMMEAA